MSLALALLYLPHRTHRYLCVCHTHTSLVSLFKPSERAMLLPAGRLLGMTDRQADKTDNHSKRRPHTKVDHCLMGPVHIRAQGQVRSHPGLTTTPSYQFIPRADHCPTRSAHTRADHCPIRSTYTTTGPCFKGLALTRVDYCPMDQFTQA